jgi:hypothetical protein
MAITKPHTFADGETIDAARQNANFDEIVAKATDKTGDTLTGTLTTRALTPSADSTYDLGSDAVRYADIFGDVIRTATEQPGFLAFTSTGSAGAGSGVLAFDEEEYDTAGNFSTNTFTAPVTGLYLFFASIHLTAISAGTAYLDLATGANTYQLDARGGAPTTLKGVIVVPMAAASTAQLSLTVSGTADIAGDTYPVSFFGGRLLA